MALSARPPALASRPHDEVETRDVRIVDSDLIRQALAFTTRQFVAPPAEALNRLLPPPRAKAKGEQT
jgi:hypothetical protein